MTSLSIHAHMIEDDERDLVIADGVIAAAEAIAVPDPTEQVELAAIRGVSVLDQGGIAGAVSVFHAGLAADPCWETWAAHGLGLHAAAAGDEASALSHLADAITRSRPQRGGHLWSHVWALTDTVPLARREGDPRAPAWHDEALTTAQRSGMRSLAGDLLQLA